MSFISKQEASFDKYRFGVMSLMIMTQSCLGSIAAYISVLNHNWVFVSIAVFAAMGSNAMFIAQAKARVCLIGFYISMALHSLILIADIFLYYL